MSNEHAKDAAAADVAPVITTELAVALAREGEAMRNEYRQRVEAMWAIAKDERQTRSR